MIIKKYGFGTVKNGLFDKCLAVKYYFEDNLVLQININEKNNAISGHEFFEIVNEKIICIPLTLCIIVDILKNMPKLGFNHYIPTENYNFILVCYLIDLINKKLN